MHIKRFAFGELATNCYVIEDEQTKQAAVLDPATADERLFRYIAAGGLCVKYILLTHGHFDHVLGCREVASRLGAKIVMSKTEASVLVSENREFGDTCEIEKIKPDILVNDGDIISLGAINLKVIATPGHTVGGISFAAEGCVFCGDTLFNASVGRTDFYGGSFETLLSSIGRLYSMPSDTAVYPGHGLTTKIGIEKASNPYTKEL